MSAENIIWQTLPAVLLALGCGSEIVTDVGASSTAASGGAVGNNSSASMGSGGTGGRAGASGTGGAATTCRHDNDCLPEEACRYTTGDGCADPLPHCVAKMSKNSDCEEGQKWDDPSSSAWACLCIGGYPSAGPVYLECGTHAYPEPVWPPGRPCGPL